MRYLPNGKQMSEADAHTIHEIGIPSLVLMERAALQIVETMHKKNISTEKSLIVCGSGNNGGDGFAVARLLTEQGKHADVLFAGKEASLSEEEYDKLMENLNDDDYVEDFMRKANLENELQQLAKAKENLIKHTRFLRLSADERTQLFILYAESNELTKVKLLKTREEGGSTSSCEEQKQAAYKQAKADYDNAIANCQNGSMPSGCLIQAAAKYDRAKDIANKKYKECIANK